MRWTDEGAHRLAQVRVGDLNGELSVQRLAALAKMPGASSSYARQAALIRPPTVWFTLARTAQPLIDAEMDVRPLRAGRVGQALDARLSATSEH
jgi:hypothetical protein